jgi:Tfp pilus assembly protein PilX
VKPIRSRSQRGATLLVALIMLVLLSLFAISSLNTATTNLRVVGNMQAKTEALNAAQESIETVISSTQFIATPANAVINPCGAANTICTDIAGNILTSPTGAEYTSTLTPQPACVTVKPIKNSELNLTNTEDLGCAAGQQQQFGVAGAVTGDSLCSNTVWEVTVRTVGTNTGTSVTVTQGVGVRISADDAGTSC